VSNFASKPEERRKKVVHDLGEFFILLHLSAEQTWFLVFLQLSLSRLMFFCSLSLPPCLSPSLSICRKDIAIPVLLELFDRNALWILKKFPELADTSTSLLLLSFFPSCSVVLPLQPFCMLSFALFFSYSFSLSSSFFFSSFSQRQNLCLLSPSPLVRFFSGRLSPDHVPGVADRNNESDRSQQRNSPTLFRKIVTTTR
jgi:hypothetical protein